MRSSLRARDVGLVGHCGSEWVPLPRTGEERDSGSEGSSGEFHFLLVNGNGMGKFHAGHSRWPYALLAFRTLRKLTVPVGGTGGRSTGGREVIGRPGTKVAGSSV